MEGLTVGDVAGRLGVSPSTVRMWGRRYGLTASRQSAGGHRRYSPDDVSRLETMQSLVLQGTDPAAAAERARAGETSGSPPAGITSGPQPGPQPGSPRRPGGPGGHVLAVPGADRATRGLARAASRLDEIAVEDALVSSMQATSALVTWNDLVRPVLVAAGEHWQRTGAGIEIEHLLSQAVATAFVRYSSRLAEAPRERPVLLAGGAREEHVLPLYALQAGLTERRVPARLLGPRTPADALSIAARRTRSAGALVWLSQTDPTAAAGLEQVTRAHRAMVTLVGGPGWLTETETLRASGIELMTSLDEAVDRLEKVWQRSS